VPFSLFGETKVPVQIKVQFLLLFEPYMPYKYISDREGFRLKSQRKPNTNRTICKGL